MSQSNDYPPPGYCALCKNTGHVTIYHPLLVKCLRASATRVKNRRGDLYRAYFPDGRLRRINAVAPCKCKLGNQFVNWNRHDGTVKCVLPRFGERDYHVVPLDDPHATDEQIAEHCGGVLVTTETLGCALTRSDPLDNQFQQALNDDFS